MALATTMALAFGPAHAQNILPSHGVVTSGAASIGQSGGSMTVNQTSPRAIVNWGSFSIGQANGVTFSQPNSSSAILNRVTGSTPSTIAGRLQANGQVYLVNPNGIAITKSGAVQTGGGFVASTLGIADSDFNKGNLNFVGNGASAGVSNAGSITTAPGGFVGLLGGTVSNSGVVSVPLGKVAMGSGEQATLNLTGDNFLQVAVPTDTKTADGKALIDVSGKVRAAGGSVQLRAATVAQAIRNAVNVPGTLSVTSARASGGSIILGGGPGGDVSVTGRLRASGRKAGGTIAIRGHDVALRQAKLAASSAKGRGGTVTVTATHAVRLVSSLVEASGATGGGAIRIGGDFHGASDLTSAQTTTIDKASTLNASATASGDGGTVAVWSNATTNFAGKITATGGPRGGDGGYAEVSANPATHGMLNFTGSADLTAPKGKTGTLLLDPTDVIICDDCDDVGGSFSSAGDWVFTGTPAPATSFLSTATLENQLGLSNVVVSTASDGPSTGNITVSAPVTWALANSLTLEAANRILIANSITASGPGSSLSLAAGGDILEETIPDISEGSIVAPTLSATSSAGRVALTLFNTVGSVSGSAPGGFSLFNSGALDVGAAGITSAAGSIALETITGSITQTGPVRGLALYAHPGTDGTGDVLLNNPNNAVGTLAGAAPGNFEFANTAGAGLTIGTVNYVTSSETTTPGTATASGVASGVFGAPDSEIQVTTAGNLTVNSPVHNFTPDGLIVLAATGNFINNVGPGAVVDPWLIYSASPTGDVFNGLDSGNTAVWNTTFGEPVTAAGNRYVFAFQPTITVTSTNDAKTYGQDVTSRVATDYVITGLQPADPSGAYLADTAAAIFTGTPSVTSLGSPATAPVAGSPYEITVAPGSFTVSDRYALALNSAGRLTVDPLAITYSVANSSSFFGTTPILGAASLFGVLPGDTVDPTVGAFLGSLLIPLNPFTPVGQYAQLVTALSNPNYAIAASGNSPGTLTVKPTAVLPFDPGFLPGLTLINNPAQTEYDVGGYEQVLPHFTVACNEPPSLPDPNRLSDPDQALRAISQSLENYFRRCQNLTQATIADALDEYAAKLRILAPRLPPALRNVPAIVAEGARRVRAARSRSEAIAVLHQTVAAVHKEIALVLSEDPQTRGRELRDGDVVAGALDRTSVALVNSGGL
ncbi:MAG TPA: filamentous hemagglutinin N-terminal domain-containing protein [Roseiarcus sp.]